MKMKKRLYFPLLLTLLASLVFGVFPPGQPATVYAAQGTENLWSESNSVSDPAQLTLTTSANADGSGIGTWADADGKWAKVPYESWTFVMANSAVGTGTTIDSVTLYIKHYQSLWEDDNFKIQIYDGSTWIDALSYTIGSGPPTSDTTDNRDVKVLGIDTWTKINAAQVRVTGAGSSGGEDPVKWFVDTVELRVIYTIVAPTVTTQAATSVEATTATGNGNITATGGEDASAWGIVWNTTGNPDTGDNVVAGTGAGGVGAFTASLTGLPTGTTIHTKAYATNTAGTSYGAEEDFLTKPAAPTDVSATDGEHTDKVVITWIQSTGATDYRVYRDAADSGPLGDVATYDDTGADAPTITPGTAAASDGDYAAHVALSLSGQSANNGTTHTYKVVAVNATGDSADSLTDTGYRDVGSLAYQWQRSEADSDAGYSNIDGATTASYDDTGAPAGGIGRYYKCIEDAGGASPQTSTADRGYRTAPDISNNSATGNSYAFGTVDAGSTHETGLTYFTVTNNSSYAVNITISGTDMTGGTTWTLSDTATPGEDTYGLKAGRATESYNIIVPKTFANPLVSGLTGTGGTQQWGLQLLAPDTFTGGGENSGTVTLTATAA